MVTLATQLHAGRVTATRPSTLSGTARTGARRAPSVPSRWTSPACGDRPGRVPASTNENVTTEPLLELMTDIGAADLLE
jgi:hypothetical protein